jgi:hypothetical protein
MKNSYFKRPDSTTLIKIIYKSGHYCAVIDTSDLDTVSAISGSWRIKNDGNTCYCHAHIKRDGKWTTISMHRLIMGVTKFCEQIDHINHDGLDNRRCNLRVVDGTQNQYNRYIASNNKSGTIGLSWSEQKGKWKAELKFKGQRIFEKYYDDKEIAIKNLEMVREAVTKVVMLKAI